MYTNYRPSYPNEILHYGILGMKWGVRRYQNEDGTYTDAGKRRYINSDKGITVTKRSGRYQSGSKSSFSKLISDITLNGVDNDVLSRSEQYTKNMMRKIADINMKLLSDYDDDW